MRSEKRKRRVSEKLIVDGWNCIISRWICKSRYGFAVTNFISRLRSAFNALPSHCMRTLYGGTLYKQSMCLLRMRVCVQFHEKKNNME